MNTVPVRPAALWSINCILLSILLLLSGNIELNPEPDHLHSSTVNIDCLNICYAANKVGFIHDIISDHCLDVQAVWETRFKSDDPPAVRDGNASDDYSVLHVHRDPSRALPLGGGLASSSSDHIH